MSAEKKIYYFAYGSNMLADRFFVNNQGTLKGVGTLKDFSLGFNAFILGWNGGVISILKKKGAQTLGVVWDIDDASLISLDKQEVSYNRIEVDVELESGEIIRCQTYEFNNLYIMDPAEEGVTYASLPSLSYMKVIIKGAAESNMPKEYINFLKTVRHNGKVAEEKEKQLHLEAFDL